MNAPTELLRPWKLATLAIGIGLLVAGSDIYEAPDWDIPVADGLSDSVLVSARDGERRWRQWPLMLF